LPLPYIVKIHIEKSHGENRQMNQKSLKRG